MTPIPQFERTRLFYFSDSIAEEGGRGTYLGETSSTFLGVGNKQILLTTIPTMTRGVAGRISSMWLQVWRVVASIGWENGMQDI